MRQILLSFALIFFSAVAAAANIARIDIVITAANPRLEELAQAVQHELQKQIKDLPITIHTNVEPEITAASHALLINIDEQLLPWTYSEKNYYAATINFYVNSTHLNADKRDDGKVTALYRDQPLTRQLALAKLLIPHLRKVAVLYDRALPFLPTQLQHERSVEIDAITIHDAPDWAKSLSQTMQSSDVLLGIDDPLVYNSNTIRSILLTTYRHGKGLIGPSRTFVNAGSLASCYTSPDQYLQQLVEMVSVAVREHRLPHPQYPNRFYVAINKQVANSLNLLIPDENTLSARMQNQNGECGDGC